MLKVLDVEGAVVRGGRRWALRPGVGLALRRRALRARSPRCAGTSRRRWPRFGADGRCLMRALQEELDDPDPRDCGRCAVCAGAALRRPARPRARARGGAAPALAADRAGGQEDGAGRGRARCARSPRTCAPRRAARSRGSATAAGTRSSRPGRRDGPLRRRAGRRRGRVGARAGACRSAGSRRCRRRGRGRWSPDFARAARRGARAAVRGGARRASPTGRRSARWRTPRSRSRTCAGAFAVDAGAAGRARACWSTTSRFSGWTLAMLAGQLRRRGAGAGLPARAGVGDLIRPPGDAGERQRRH